jgi:succinoglycan biosynthesis protein ExoM
MKYSICINTYKRPELLKILLNSLVTQKLDSSLSIEIIVVENDNIQLSKPIVNNYEILMRNNPNWQFKYFIQPIKNIAITRNKAVAEATGDYIFFIDDDEYAAPEWIIKTITCLNDYKADAVFGAVISYFDKITPVWIQRNKMFHREIQKTGTPPNFTRTGNCLIKAQWLKMIEGPFDPEYGTTGGEDSHLFNYIYIKGAKFVFCAESIVYEYVPPERANLKWLQKRSLRTGNSYARRTIENSKIKSLTKIYLLIKAAFFMFLNAAILILTLFSRRISSNYLIKIFGYIGHIYAVFNIYYEEYK